MAKIMDGAEALMTREQYNALKKMDRLQAEEYLRRIFDRGYKKGYRTGRADAEAKHEDDESRAISTIISTLVSASGIGPATIRKIHKALGSGGD